MRGQSSRIALACVARAHRRQAQALDQTFDNAFRLLARLDDARGQARASRPRPTPESAGALGPDAPNRRLQLVLDQPVGGGRIRHAQTAPRPAPSAPAPPWWTANRRAGSPRPRRDRRLLPGSPRSDGWPGHRSGPRRQLGRPDAANSTAHNRLHPAAHKGRGKSKMSLPPLRAFHHLHRASPSTAITPRQPSSLRSQPGAAPLMYHPANAPRYLALFEAACSLLVEVQ